MTEPVHFSTYQQPRERRDPSMTVYHKSRVLDFGINVERYYQDQRWGNESLEWFTGEKASPTHQYLTAAALVLAMLEASGSEYEIYGQKLPTVQFVGQFTSPIDTDGHDGIIYGTMNSVLSQAPPRFSMRSQPFQYNTATGIFQYESHSTPEVVDEQGTQAAIEALRAVRDALVLRDSREIEEAVRRSASPRHTSEPTNAELALERATSLWESVKSFFLD